MHLSQRSAKLNVALFGTAALVTVAAFVVAITGFYDQPRPGFVELWLQPTDQPTTVALGIRNEDQRTITVQLVLKRGTLVEATWAPITLSNHETWQGTASVPDFPSGSDPLVATLTAVDPSDALVRQVDLWPPAGP